MVDRESKLAASLTAQDKKLIPFLPYLLQDLWELGSIPQQIIRVLKDCPELDRKSHLLDLACGKGAVSIEAVRNLGCQAKGIDLMPSFISYARTKALAYGLSERCRFQVGDVLQAVEEERNYDVVVWGASGDLLGNPLQTVRQLSKVLGHRGYILIDDAYTKKAQMEGVVTREEWLSAFDKAEVTLVRELPVDSEQLKAINAFNQKHIAQRAQELALRFPEMESLFIGYIESQQREIDLLEQEWTSVLWLLSKTNV